MIYVYTLFDRSKDSYPLISGVYDPGPKSARFFPFYLGKTGLSIYNIEEHIKIFKDVVNGKDLVLNDYKQHCIAFDLDKHGEVYDVDIPLFKPDNDIKVLRNNIVSILAKMPKIKLYQWHLSRGKAAVVYACLQRKGVMYGYKIVYPIWGRAYSGRSKTTGFSLQGAVKDDNIANVNGDKIFINFDWIAADLRVISIMSGDPELQESFMVSDPYSYFIDVVNEGNIINPLARNEGKMLLFRAAYSLDYDNPALDFYGGFRKWIEKRKSELNKYGCVTSILGRKFSVSHGRTERSVINAIVQGSVAHAMHAVIRRAWDKLPDNILVENHDSLTMTSNRDNVKGVIDTVVDIMLHPFRGILESDPVFPIKISIGGGYRDWRVYKEVRSSG